MFDFYMQLTECVDAGVAPFSVVDPAAVDALSHLLSLTFATTDASGDSVETDEVTDASPSSACSLRALLAVPPAEMARWMVFDAPVQHDDGAVALVGGESIGTLQEQQNLSTALSLIVNSRERRRICWRDRYHCGRGHRREQT
jgi:hypothetical protein